MEEGKMAEHWIRNAVFAHPFMKTGALLPGPFREASQLQQDATRNFGSFCRVKTPRSIV